MVGKEDFGSGKRESLEYPGAASGFGQRQGREDGLASSRREKQIHFVVSIYFAVIEKYALFLSWIHHHLFTLKHLYELYGCFWYINHVHHIFYAPTTV